MNTPADLETVITTAAEQGRSVVFNYQKPGDVPELREVIPDPEQPIRLSKGGDRYVIGHDPNRDAPRNFRLDRIRQATVR